VTPWMSGLVMSFFFVHSSSRSLFVAHFPYPASLGYPWEVMIRRRVGDEFWLFTQHDHALLSGELARHFGGVNLFKEPEPFDRTILGIALHDCGWPLHDDMPTLNSKGEPLDVFETPPHIGLKVWSASADRAATRDASAGMLVSLHALSLSNLAMSQTHSHYNWNDPRLRFEMNKFQHARIEMHDVLRGKLGMRTDIPLENGLALRSAEPAEQNLIFNFLLLQAMDKLSLDICCTEMPFPIIPMVPTAPGSQCVHLSVTRSSAEEIRLEPWPCKSAKVEAEISYRVLPAASFENEATFRSDYAAAPARRLALQITGPSGRSPAA
jgi:hypothetical protein